MKSSFVFKSNIEFSKKNSFFIFSYCWELKWHICCFCKGIRFMKRELQRNSRLHANLLLKLRPNKLVFLNKLITNKPKTNEIHNLLLSILLQTMILPHRSMLLRLYFPFVICSHIQHRLLEVLM